MSTYLRKTISGCRVAEYVLQKEGVASKLQAPYFHNMKLNCSQCFLRVVSKIRKLQQKHPWDQSTSVLQLLWASHPITLPSVYSYLKCLYAIWIFNPIFSGKKELFYCICFDITLIHDYSSVIPKPHKSDCILSKLQR